jgi:hypothetical protein
MTDQAASLRGRFRDPTEERVRTPRLVVAERAAAWLSSATISSIVQT